MQCFVFEGLVTHWACGSSPHSPPTFIFQVRNSEVSHWMMWARNCAFWGGIVIQLELFRDCIFFPHCKYVYVWSLYACSTPWCSVVNRVTELYCGYGWSWIGWSCWWIFETWMLTDLMYFSLRDFLLDSPGGCLASLGLGVLQSGNLILNIFENLNLICIKRFI